MTRKNSKNKSHVKIWLYLHKVLPLMDRHTYMMTVVKRE